MRRPKDSNNPKEIGSDEPPRPVPRSLPRPRERGSEVDEVVEQSKALTVNKPPRPTVVAPRDSVYDKMISQVEQVKARSGLVLAVAHAGDEVMAHKADFVLPIPQASELLTPILAVLPLQVFAYEMAVRRGADVDQPRNLAKSVTVE